MEELWKSVALLLAGVVTGGAAGILRGDWLGGRAAASVKAQLEMQISSLRTEQVQIEARLKEDNDRLEKRLKDDINQFALRIETRLNEYYERMDGMSKRIHDSNSNVQDRMAEILLVVADLKRK